MPFYDFEDSMPVPGRHSFFTTLFMLPVLTHHRQIRSHTACPDNILHIIIHHIHISQSSHCISSVSIPPQRRLLAGCVNPFENPFDVHATDVTATSKYLQEYLPTAPPNSFFFLVRAYPMLWADPPGRCGPVHPISLAISQYLLSLLEVPQ